MKNLTKCVLTAIAASVICGCAGNIQTFVDPGYHHADWNTIQPAPAPIPVKLAVQFQQNGQPMASVDPGLRQDVAQALRRSQVFNPVDDDSATATLTVTANNLANLDAAKSKGRSAAYSFGSNGSTVEDNYVFDIAYQDGNGRSFDHSYDHRLVSTLGKTEAPEGMQPTTLAAGFQQVVQDVVLNFIQDWQTGAVASSR